MPSILLEMRFACWICDEVTTITVHCAGTGLATPSRVLAKAKAPCYHCGRIHEVVFRPTGEVVGVHPEQSERPCAVPSYN